MRKSTHFSKKRSVRKVASTKPDETTIAKRGEQEEDETGDQDSIPKNRSPQTRHVEESSMDDNVDQATASNEQGNRSRSEPSKGKDVRQEEEEEVKTVVVEEQSVAMPCEQQQQVSGDTPAEDAESARRPSTPKASAIATIPTTTTAITVTSTSSATIANNDKVSGKRSRQSSQHEKRRPRRTRSLENIDARSSLSGEKERSSKRSRRTDQRAFREQVMQRVEEEGLDVQPKDMLFMLLDLIRNHHEKIARKSDMKRKIDSDHPCSLTRTVQDTYDTAMVAMKDSIEESFQPRLIENTRNSKSSATIVGLEKLISELETEEKEWEKVEKLLPNGIERISETLLDRGIEEKINAAPELHPDGSMNDQITQALYAQTEKVDDVTIMMTHMTHFSNKIGESARSMTRKIGQNLKKAQEADRVDPQELIANVLKTA